MGDLIELDERRQEKLGGMTVLYSPDGLGGLVVPTDFEDRIKELIETGYSTTNPDLEVPECIVTPFEKRKGEDDEN